MPVIPQLELVRESELEFAIFAGEDPNSKFSKILSFSKSDLAHSSGIVSIEGGCLLQNFEDGSIELFISTEKRNCLPKTINKFPKTRHRCLEY